MTNRVSSSPLVDYRQDGIRFYMLPDPFHMYRGGQLKNARIAYETWGKLNKQRSNGILVFTGLSPSAHAASSPENPTPGWWEYMIGPGKPIDSDKYFVICVNSLGSCFGSTGPASIDPQTGQPYRQSFPELSIEDIASSAHCLVQSLGIRSLQVVTGASLGGMSALAYAVDFADQVNHLIAISTATQATTFAIAIRSLQRDIIRSDSLWDNGNYSFDNPPNEGMRLARKLGLTSYRSAAEWQARFSRKHAEPAPSRSFDPEFEVEAYLEHNASKFVGTFDPNCYLYLSRAMDWFELGEHGGTLDAAVAQLKTRKNLVIGVESDFLFPVWQQQELARLLRQANSETAFVPLPSIQGHDSFLVDQDNFAPAVERFLSSLD